MCQRCSLRQAIHKSLPQQHQCFDHHDPRASGGRSSLLKKGAEQVGTFQWERGDRNQCHYRAYPCSERSNCRFRRSSRAFQGGRAGGHAYIAWAKDLPDRVLAVAKATALNRSSMVQDGGVSRNLRKFRHSHTNLATIASRSMSCPAPRKV